MKYHTWNKVSPANYWEIKRNILIDDPNNKLYNIGLYVLNNREQFISSNSIKKYTLRKSKSCPILCHKFTINNSIDNSDFNFKKTIQTDDNFIIKYKKPQSLPDYLEIKDLEDVMPKYLYQYGKWI